MARKQTRRARGGTTPVKTSPKSEKRSRSKSRSPSSRRTKKFRFNDVKLHDVKTYDLDDNEKDFKLGLTDPIEQTRRQRVASLPRCPPAKMIRNYEGELSFQIPKAPSRYPCSHRGIIFEDEQEYADYYSSRAAKLNINGDTVADHYDNFVGRLQPSASKRKQMEKQRVAQNIFFPPIHN